MRSVLDMLAACDGLARLAAYADAPTANLRAYANVCGDYCRDCAAACKKHADHHAPCKACMESCDACLKACEALAARSAVGLIRTAGRAAPARSAGRSPARVPRRESRPISVFPAEPRRELLRVARRDDAVLAAPDELHRAGDPVQALGQAELAERPEQRARRLRSRGSARSPTRSRRRPTDPSGGVSRAFGVLGRLRREERRGSRARGLRPHVRRPARPRRTGRSGAISTRLLHGRARERGDLGGEHAADRVADQVAAVEAGGLEQVERRRSPSRRGRRACGELGPPPGKPGSDGTITRRALGELVEERRPLAAGRRGRRGSRAARPAPFSQTRHGLAVARAPLRSRQAGALIARTTARGSLRSSRGSGFGHQRFSHLSSNRSLQLRRDALGEELRVVEGELLAHVAVLQQAA